MCGIVSFDIVSPACDIVSPACDIVSQACDIVSPACDIASPACEWRQNTCTYWTTQSYTLDLERRANGIARPLQTRCCRNKWNRHGPLHAVLGFALSACAATTNRRLDSHLLRLLYIAARKRAQLLHVYHRPLTNVDHRFGISFAQSRARIGAAVAKGMAL